METRICALREFGECSKEFEITSKSPHQRCCCAQHGTRRRWLKRKLKIKVALEAVASKERIQDGR